MQAYAYTFQTILIDMMEHPDAYRRCYDSAEEKVMFEAGNLLVNGSVALRYIDRRERGLVRRLHACTRATHLDPNLVPVGVAALEEVMLDAIADPDAEVRDETERRARMIADDSGTFKAMSYSGFKNIMVGCGWD